MAHTAQYEMLSSVKVRVVLSRWRGQKEPVRREMRKLIDQMAARGFNHVLVNVYAHDTAWAPGKSCPWDYGPPEMYAWEGSNEKPDHLRLNTGFFPLYDGMMNALRDKGIVAHIMFKVYNKRVNWPAPGSVDEERYFKYVTARYQGCSNVVWDFSKESFNEKDKTLQKRLIDLIRSHDAYHRLVTAHDNDVYHWNPELNANTDFRTDQQHTSWAEAVTFDRTLRKWPVITAETGGYERGVKDLPSYGSKQEWQDVMRRAYLGYLAGGYGVYYYSNTAWDVVKSEPEPPGTARFQQLETAAYLPEVPLFVEYQPSETRVHCTLDSAAKALLLCDAVGNPNLGVTIDLGHSIYGGETPAEVLALVAASGFPYYVHINDNNGKWDWDLMAGTCNLWLYVEFLYYLKELGYDGWITSDTSPVRQDPIETFAFNVRITERIWQWLDQVDREAIRHHLDRHEYLPILKTFEPCLLAGAPVPSDAAAR